jgi:hypothetical protein
MNSHLTSFDSNTLYDVFKCCVKLKIKVKRRYAFEIKTRIHLTKTPNYEILYPKPATRQSVTEDEIMGHFMRTLELCVERLEQARKTKQKKKIWTQYCAFTRKRGTFKPLNFLQLKCFLILNCNFKLYYEVSLLRVHKIFQNMYL